MQLDVAYASMADGTNVWPYKHLVKPTFDGLIAGTYVQAAMADPDCPFDGAAPSFVSAQASAATIACSNARQHNSQDPPVSINLRYHATEYNASQASRYHSTRNPPMYLSFRPSVDNTDCFRAASRKLFGVKATGSELRDGTPIIGEEGEIVGVKGGPKVLAQRTIKDADQGEMNLSAANVSRLSLQ